MARPGLNDTFMQLAQVLSLRGSCIKRQVGCVVVDVHGHVVSTGWNGRPKIMGNCHIEPCATGCDGVHAEVNALLQAKGQGWALYVTHAPCWHCMKTIVNSGVKKVVFHHGDTLEPRAMRLAADAGIQLLQWPAMMTPVQPKENSL